MDGDDNGIQGVMDMQGVAGDSIFSGIVTLGDDEPVDDAEDAQGGDQDDASDLEDISGNQTVDFGLFPGVSLGSTVFADRDADGYAGCR